MLLGSLFFHFISLCAITTAATATRVLYSLSNVEVPAKYIKLACQSMGPFEPAVLSDTSLKDIFKIMERRTVSQAYIAKGVGDRFHWSSKNKHHREAVLAQMANDSLITTGIGKWERRLVVCQCKDRDINRLVEVRNAKDKRKSNVFRQALKASLKLECKLRRLDRKEIRKQSSISDQAKHLFHQYAKSKSNRLNQLEKLDIIKKKLQSEMDHIKQQLSEVQQQAVKVSNSTKETVKSICQQAQRDPQLTLQFQSLAAVFDAKQNSKIVDQYYSRS